LSGKAYIALADYDRASNQLLRAIDLAESMRTRIAGREEQKSSFFERKIEPYYLMVDLLARQNKREDALILAERARSRALLDLLGRSTLDIGSAISQVERDEEKRLDGQLTALNTQLYRESQRSQPDKEHLADLKARLAQARIDYDSVLDRLYVNHPEL